MRIWVVSETNAGTLNQALGVAEELSSEPIIKIVRKERGLRRLLFPFRQDRREAQPDIIVSCGRISERFVRIMKRSFGNRPFAVHLQPPAPENDCFDVVFVSRHDWQAKFGSQPRFRPMLGVPHRMKAERLAGERDAARAKWAPHDERVVALLIGGPSKAFIIDDETLRNLEAAVLLLLSQGWKVLATMSRRSPKEIAERLGKITEKRFRLWNFDGDNPYAEYLAAADAFLVTEDSVTMISEAAASGKPIHTLPLGIRSVAEAEKFTRFHADLLSKGVARPFQGNIEMFTYPPQNETVRIASAVRQLFLSAQA
jgi:mitochondrial fission protein ELM1